MIDKMHGVFFNWQLWRSGSPKLLDIVCREKELIESKEIIKKYAIGYCDGASLVCRPKVDCIGVMFFKDEINFWFHLTKKEFNIIFKNEKIKL